MISEQIVCVANTPCLLLSGRSLVRIQFGVPKSRSFLFYGLRLFAMQKAKMGGPFGAAHFCIFSFLFSCQQYLQQHQVLKVYPAVTVQVRVSCLRSHGLPRQVAAQPQQVC